MLRLIEIFVTSDFPTISLGSTNATTVAITCKQNYHA